MGGISIWQLLIIAVIVVLLFGTKNGQLKMKKQCINAQKVAY